MLRRSMMNLSPPTLLELDSPAHRKVCGLFSLYRCRYGLVDRFLAYLTGRDDAPKDKKLVVEHGDKIDIARILIERIDGVVAQARVSSLALANAVLERWARDAPEKGEGQCQIRIIFEDGFHYQSHIGLSRSQKRISLARLLRQQLLMMSTPKTGQRKRKDGDGRTANTMLPALPLNPEAVLARYDI